MTCIVGLVDKGRVYLGGDSASIDGTDITLRADPKVFRNGDFVMGYTTSFRLGNLLQHSLVPPRHHPDDDIRKFMVTEFIDAVRDCLKNGGYAATGTDAEAGGTFLVGYQGRLFSIQDDYQVGEGLDGFMACGCGEKYALGSLGTSTGRPRDRVLKALSLAERWSAGVRAPFHLEVI
ncbi:hypothetical protein NKJ23_16020 [Mesorhizobium sp. M0184]|uniref:hypothetical protein n=1 Tax=Mesorhizobium sp. M0184 TaxID=2956906 RepID=UPI00333A0C43